MAFLNQLQSKFVKKSAKSPSSSNASVEKEEEINKKDIDRTGLFNVLQVSPFHTKYLILDIRCFIPENEETEADKEEKKKKKERLSIVYSTHLNLYDRHQKVLPLDTVQRLSQIVALSSVNSDDDHENDKNQNQNQDKDKTGSSGSGGGDDNKSKSKNKNNNNNTKAKLQYIDTLKVIIYDQDGKDYELCQKIQDICIKYEKVTYCRILKDGFLAFWNKYPFACVDDHQENENENDSNSECTSAYKPKERQHLKYPNEVVENFMYLGTKLQAQNELIVLKNLGITHIVNVTEDAPNAFVAKGINYYRIPINDLEHVDIKRYFEESFTFIEESLQAPNRSSTSLTVSQLEEKKEEQEKEKDKIQKPTKILIHCEHGISRSASIVICYLMKKNKWSYDHAYQLVQEQRPQVSPNSGFMRQLKEWQNELGL